MRAGWKYFGNAGRAQARLAASDHRTQARTTGTDDDNIIAVILDGVGAAVDRGNAVRISIRCHD
jgi:hypothetical protein